MGGEISHVAVFGPGLMGASLLMALRRKSPRTKLSVWARRKEAADEIVKHGLADVAGTDAAEAASGADTVVLCVPVDRMADIARSMAPHIGADTLVTDVGSTKKTVTAELGEIFSDGKNFLGSHPMCGSEESGLGAARADLYEGALCVVCPTDSSRPDLLARTEALWQMVGGRVARLSPADHDKAAAATSHAPHIAAAALVALVASEPDTFRALCASGFRDTTRVASGSPELWSAILAANAGETAAALERLEKILASYRQAITSGSRDKVAAMLQDAVAQRAKIFPKN